jgi:hypothetical protein
MENGISASIAFPKNMLKLMRQNDNLHAGFANGWRSSFFGMEFNEMLTQKKSVNVIFKNGKIIIE